MNVSENKKNDKTKGETYFAEVLKKALEEKPKPQGVKNGNTARNSN